MKRAMAQIGLLRISQIIGDAKRGIPAIIPVSKSTWWVGVKTGRFPKPVKISERCTAWRAEDIMEFVSNATNES